MITILNLVRIIYSLFCVYKSKGLLDSDVIEKIIEERNINNLKTFEMCIWINYLKALGVCKNWSKAQMLRQMIIRKKLNRILKKNEWEDFDLRQTFTTYLKRVLGNILV